MRGSLRALGHRQPFAEDPEGAVQIAGPGFSLSERNLQQTIKHQNILFAQQFNAAAHVLEPRADCAGRRGRPAL